MFVLQRARRGVWPGSGWLLGVVICCGGLTWSSGLQAQEILLLDEFSGTGRVDQALWRLPFGGPGSFLGRTQLKTDLSTGYPVQSGGAALLQLDTFLDDGMGGSAGVFSGAEINTKRNFAVGGGIRMEARARLVSPPPGLVGGMFFFDVTRADAMGNPLRDEIDHELLSNEVQPGGQGRGFTNIWNEGPFVGPGSGGDPQFVLPSLPGGFDMTQFHTYRVDWLPQRVNWFVDDVLVRSVNSQVPDDPMNFRLNLWAPDTDFAAAYSADLQPAANPGANATFEMAVERVQITRLNTQLSANLLLDPSFDDTSVPIITDPTATGGWFLFANAFFDTSIAARTGFFTGKTFGPFDGNTGASGFFQNVEASPGEVFEASAFALSPAFDSVKGTSNFATVKIEFLDATGSIINANAKESILLNGLDPDMPEDTWVLGTVNAIAPEGTTKARVVLPFVQFAEGNINPPAQDPGAIWFDDVSLQRLTAIPGVTADFNGDGLLDCQDIDALTSTIAGATNNPDFDLTGDGLVDTADLNQWLADAGAENLGPGRSYLLGDANLDGGVDVSDFNLWNGQKFTSGAAWCGGDFNADGSVDVSDFNLWNGNKFQSAANLSAVPEPMTGGWLLCCLGVSLARRRKTRGAPRLELL